MIFTLLALCPDLKNCYYLLLTISYVLSLVLQLYRVAIHCVSIYRLLSLSPLFSFFNVIVGVLASWHCWCIDMLSLLTCWHLDNADALTWLYCWQLLCWQLTSWPCCYVAVNVLTLWRVDTWHVNVAGVLRLLASNALILLTYWYFWRVHNWSVNIFDIFTIDAIADSWRIAKTKLIF